MYRNSLFPYRLIIGDLRPCSSSRRRYLRVMTDQDAPRNRNSYEERHARSTSGTRPIPTSWALSTTSGNRFLIYVLFPDVNVSVRLHWGPGRQFVVAAVGHSIFDRTCKTNVGELMSRYGGGGHKGAGTTPLSGDRIETAIEEIVAELKRNG